MRNPNIVKAVLDRDSNALYFSRAPIPTARRVRTPSPAGGRGVGGEGNLPDGLPVLRHIGIYAYRASFLRAFGQLAPAGIEHFEALEQLRALYHGYKIGVYLASEAPPPASIPNRICTRHDKFSKHQIRRKNHETDIAGPTRRGQRHTGHLHQGKIQHPADFDR